jgi:Mg2+ and Co2+ transporter CorA
MEVLGIILVDPPVGNDFFPDETGLLCNRSVYHAQSGLVQGGFVDFSAYPTLHESTSHGPTGPDKVSMLEDLIYYWTKEQAPPGFTLNNPSLLSLSCYSLNIAAGEFMNVAKFSQHFVETYERAVEKRGAELTILDNDLRHIYTFRRRLIMYEEQCQLMIQLCQSVSPELVGDGQMDWRPAIIQDYEFLRQQLGSIGLRAERMIPVITSLVQIVEGRQSFQETTNLSRLTNLALVFMPLSFTASLFSMGGEVGPGSSQFWIYFAVAVPLLFLTFSLTIWNRILAFLRRRNEIALSDIRRMSQAT